MANVVLSKDLRENYHQGNDETNSSQRAISYFSKVIFPSCPYFVEQLSPGDVRSLYQLYRLDFLLFGYSASSFLLP
jgi:hypothetical protein